MDHWAFFDRIPTIYDIINGSFELLGGVFIMLSCFKAYKDKEVKGVSFWHIGFFLTWAIWNLIFYPAYGAWMSTYGGVGVLTANLVWGGMAVYYRYRKKPCTTCGKSQVVLGEAHAYYHTGQAAIISVRRNPVNPSVIDVNITTKNYPSDTTPDALVEIIKLLRQRGDYVCDDARFESIVSAIRGDLDVLGADLDKLRRLHAALSAGFNTNQVNGILKEIHP